MAPTVHTRARTYEKCKSMIERLGLMAVSTLVCVSVVAKYGIGIFEM